jgi:hypothetical protein
MNACENLLQRKLGWLEWRGLESRYRAIHGTVRRTLEEERIVHHNTFDQLVVQACSYPEHGRENYNLIRAILKGKTDIYKSGAAIRLSVIYEPFTTDADTERLNQEVIATIKSMLAGERADAAAIALGDIAEKCKVAGPVPEEIVALLSGEVPDLNPQAKPRLAYAQRQVEGIVSWPPPANATALAFPWQRLVGKSVVVWGLTSKSDEAFGNSIVVGKRRIWIDKNNEWPQTVDRDPIIVHGTLTVIEDIPTFRYVKGAPFGAGLPTTDPAEELAAKRRYVLVDAEWHWPKKTGY